MLQAGAEKVYWLRVLQEYLDAGVYELFEKILAENNFSNNSLCYICESNSARNAIKPGAFLVIREKDNSFIKPSCQKVINKADLTIEFNSMQKNYDYDESNIDFNGEFWTLK